MNLRGLKYKKRKWTMLTAYDAPTAELLENLGTDFILIGDSLGMVLLGYASTAEVSMDEMIHHAKAVRRGAPKTFLIGDLPLKGVVRGPAQALESARRFIREAGVDAVKLEWRPGCLEILDRLVRGGIPVLAHIGLTPQSVKPPEHFRVRGQTAAGAAALFDQAVALERHGAFGLLMECVPWPVARVITGALKIPTFGIGAGRYCDGQVLVFHDVVGLFTKFTPRFVKRYLDGDRLMKRAVARFIGDVRTGHFPRQKNSFGIKETEWASFRDWFKGRRSASHGS